MLGNTKISILECLDFASFYRGEVENLGKANGDGWALGLCCFHNDHNPSLSVSLKTGQFKCFSCSESGSVFDFYMKKYNVHFKTSLDELAKIAGIDTSKKEHSKQTEQTTGKIVATYVYTDKTGKSLHRTVKTDPKDFFQEHLDVKGNWIKGVKGVQLVLYNLPKVINSSDVYFVEGERDCAALSKLGFCATTNPMGSGKLPGQQEKHSILNPLSGKRVFAVPDKDEPGKKHVSQLATLLYGKAREVRIIELPGLSEGQDVSDFIQKHGDKEAKTKIIELTAIAPVWAPPKNFLSADELLSATYEKKTPIIAKGIMPHNSHIIISGETGIGKSLLRLELALHLVMGWEWLGFEIPTARKVSIFQFENTEAMEQTRLKRMCSGLGIREIPKGRLSYVDRKNRINLTLKRDREKLLELVKESDAEVIIYDCLSNLHSAKENDNIQMRDVLDSLTEINAKVGKSCILIHHFGKPTEWQETRYRTRGAQSIIDWSVTAMAFTVRKHEHKMLRQLEFIKVRDGAEPKPILLERDENFLLNITDEDSLCPASKVKEILEDLGGEVDRQVDLIEGITNDVGCSIKSAKRYIQNAVKMEAIREIGHGHGKKKQYHI